MKKNNRIVAEYKQFVNEITQQLEFSTSGEENGI